MAEIDLVPGDYRRLVQLRRWLGRFGLAYAGLLLVLGVAKAALAYGVQARNQEIERLEAARQLEREQQGRIAALEKEKRTAERRLQILSGLRGGVAAVDMFRVVDRAGDGEVWFLDWNFRRAGELVENDPKAVQTGFFIVLPLEDKRDEREKAWLMHTHMELHAQARHHSALAGFVRRLVEQPEIEEARVLSTQTLREGGAEVVDFELAMVVRTRGG